MGASLSVQETAYSQLSRELKSQNSTYTKSLASFIDNFTPYATDTDHPAYKSSKYAPIRLLELLKEYICESSLDCETIKLTLQSLSIVFCYAGAYAAAYEQSEEFIDNLLDVLRKKDKLNAECVVAAIMALRALIIRQFCRSNSKYDTYESQFRDVFIDRSGFEMVSNCIDWKGDEEYIVCEAACLLFFDFLNNHRDQFTCTFVVTVQSYVVPLFPFLSQLTEQPKCVNAAKLLKALLLTCSCSELHDFQLKLLQSGVFLFHLQRALKSEKDEELRQSHEMVLVTVTASSEGMRTLSRVFPAPLVKKLELPSGAMKLDEISYKEPEVNTGNDQTLLDNMTLVTVFAPLRANWSGFWNAINTHSSCYNFIWDKSMKEQVLKSLTEEINDLQYHPLWDFDGYRMQYPSLQQFICVDGYYLQQMIEAYDQSEKVEIVRPVEFIHDLCDLFIVTRNIVARRALLYLIMRVVQENEAAVKDFPVMRYLCFLLQDTSLDPVLESCMLQVLQILCQKQRNTEQFQDYNGLDTVSRVLVTAIHDLINGGRCLKTNLVEKDGLHCDAKALLELDRVKLVVEILHNACNSMARIRGDMLQEPILPRMLQVLLLLADTSLIDSVLDIIIVASSNTKLKSELYLSGVFRTLLLTSCGELGMTEMTAELLSQYHLVQNSTDVQANFEINGEKVDVSNLLKAAGNDKEKVVALARKYSYLRFFLPVPMIALLVREGPKRFCDVFNADVIETADVLWGNDARAHMLNCIQDQMASYMESINTEATSPWKYTVPKLITYETIENKLCVYNVFLDAFLKQESVLPSTVDPGTFLMELSRELELHLNVVHNMKNGVDMLAYADINMILLSIKKLLIIKTEVSKVDKAVFAELSRCLSADLLIRSNQEMAILALDVILEAMEPQNYGKTNNVNIFECAEADMIVKFNCVLEKACTDDFFKLLEDEDSPAFAVLNKTIQCVYLMATKATTRALETLVACPEFIHNMTYFINVDSVQQIPAMGLIMMRAFLLFLKDDKLLEICVNSGCLIYFMQITLCISINNETDREIVDTAVACLMVLAGIGNLTPPPTTVVEVMKQLLTPGLIKTLKNGTFLNSVRNSNVREPLLIWNIDMANRLAEELDEEEKKISETEGSNSAYWNAQAFLHPSGYLHIFTSLQQEFIVDDVFLSVFLEKPNTELTDPTPDHFMKALMSNIVQLQSTVQTLVGSDAGAMKVWLQRLLISLKSLQQLLDYHTNLQLAFINDSNVRKLFDLLKDTTIGWNLQEVLLKLLENAVSTTTGCDILSSSVPDLRQLLQSKCDKVYMPVLLILKKFIEHNDQVVQLIMSRWLILVLLDMILFYENQYDGNVQDMAVHLLGLLMKNSKYGNSVRQYVVALFTPLFRGENEKSAVLANCDDYPSDFLEVISSEIHAPNVYWDSNVKEDLLYFLRKEAQSICTSDADYVYAEADVMKRMKSSRTTLNKQLVVSDIFIQQYIESPFCEMDTKSFLTGVITQLNTLVHSVQLKEQKNVEDYAALVKALSLFLPSDGGKLDASMYAAVVAFCVSVLRKDIKTAQDSVLASLKYLVQNKGLDEFERNNSAMKERSYVVDLLVASSIMETRDGSRCVVTEIIKTLIQRSAVLRSSFYHAGILLYAVNSVLSNIEEIDTPLCTARIFLEIIKELVVAEPHAEDDMLMITTSKFKGYFEKEPSIVNLFIRKPHEAFDSDNAVRVWSPDTRDALREFTKKAIDDLNVETYMNANWDRTSCRFQLDRVSTMWKHYTKNNTEVQRKFTEDTTAIKLRQTTVGPRPSYAPPAPISKPRADSN